ncbi:hypothetical protein ACFLWY_02485 [Chloroflexota bacterium]
MVENELNETESENSPEGEELEDSRVAELKAMVAQKDEELTRANARVNELEEGMARAVARYRATVVRSYPEVPEELVSGDTIESIDESLVSAKTLVGKVRRGLEAEVASSKVPAGAPQRTPPDLSALSPREKIQYAVGGKK